MKTSFAQQVSDKKLHLKFLRLGNDRRKLTNGLLALLPEIYSKQIYRKYAATIVEYAGKFGGLSKGVVLKRLRLEKHLENKPLLKEAIKVEGVHKVALVAGLATAETEEIWVDKLKNMSKAAVQELSKEVRSRGIVNIEDDAESTSLFKEKELLAPCTNPNCKAVPLKLKIELDENLTGLFLRLKKKFGKNLSNMEIIKKIFEVALGERVESQKSACVGAAKAEKVKDTRNGNIFEKNVSAVKVVPGDRNSLRKFPSAPLNNELKDKGNIFYKNISTRYIPAKIKKHVLTKSNHHCSYPNCNKPAEIFHHTERFATSKSHDSLVTLCKTHHEFAHNGLVQNETAQSSKWTLRLQNGKLNSVDELYRNYMGSAAKSQ